MPSLDPGAPIADPGIGATGDDSAAPEPFDALAQPASIAAITSSAAQVAAIAAGVAAAAGAAAAAAGAAAGAASASAGASASSSGSASSNSSGSGSSGQNSSGQSDQLGSIDYAHDEITLVNEGWGDRLAIFGFAWLTIVDSRSRRLAERIAGLSPLAAKIINDGAYARAIFGSLSLLPVIAAAFLGFAAGLANGPTVSMPGWQLLLAIAILGVFDAAAGFAATLLFAITSLSIAGFAGLTSVSVILATAFLTLGPAMIATALRGIRKAHAADFDSWWERLTDLLVIPFMSGWSAYTIVAVIPAVTGLTNNAANHIRDFALFIAMAGVIRVLGEETAARWFPKRLDRINPDSFVEPGFAQKSISLLLRYAFWLLAASAIFGLGWQVWVGSALFIVPTVLGWYADRYPNSPRLWKLLPIGVPGLAFALVLSASTSALLAVVFGATPALAQWSFVLTPLPLLAFALLGMFGRHGTTLDENRPVKRFVWLYRIGGVAMFVLTLKLAGVF